MPNRSLVTALTGVWGLWHKKNLSRRANYSAV